MASAKHMAPKRTAPYYSLTDNVVINGKTVRKYGRFERSEQQKAVHVQPSTTLAIYTQVCHKRQDSIRNQMNETLYKSKNPEI